MQRIRDLLTKTGFSVFLFCLSIIFFGWPMLTLIKKDQPEDIFLYLFICWGIFIVLLYLIGRNFKKPTNK